VVVDAADPAKLAGWWSETLGWSASAGDDLLLLPPRPGVPALLFEPVHDPKVTKNRVHLDLATRSAADQAGLVAQLMEGGARRVDVDQGDVPWEVMADPEGNEVCVLDHRSEYTGGGAGRLAAIVVDARRPLALALFWVAASGWQAVSGLADGEGVRLAGPSGGPPYLELIAVPGAKVTKNRVHLDVAPLAGAARDDEVRRLLEAGAQPAHVGQGPDVPWVVLADPEGNELCVVEGDEPA
jgi:hypothetical protein